MSGFFPSSALCFLSWYLKAYTPRLTPFTEICYVGQSLKLMTTIIF